MKSMVEQRPGRPRWYQGVSLFRIAVNEEQPGGGLFDFLFTLVFIVASLSIGIAVATIQYRHIPTVLLQYESTNPIPRAGYTCGCSLPDYLMGLKSLAQISDNTSLKKCYTPESLEDITVVQFSNTTNAELPGLLNKMGFGVDASEISFRNLRNGRLVTQQVREQILWYGDPTGYFERIFANNNGWQGQDLESLDMDSILKEMYFDFPLGYMRMSFQYDCSDCSTCSPEHIMNFPNFTGMDITSWLRCSGFGGGGANCLVDNTYHGRCTLYPAYTLPMSFKLKTLLRNFRNIPNISTTGSTLSTWVFTLGSILLESSITYVNISNLLENQPITYGFVEVERGSTRWLQLTQKYTELGTGCQDAAKVRVCNGTSMCNVYKTTADISSTSLNLLCMDLGKTNRTRCEEAASASVFPQDLCRENFTCQDVSTNTVSFMLEHEPDEGQDIDRDLVIGYFNQSWMSIYARSVCSNTYTKVLRHQVPGNPIRLLHANCTPGTKLCALNGFYNLINDTQEDGRRQLSKEDFDPRDESAIYVCYATARQSLLSWGINTAGVLSGVLGALYTMSNLIFHGTYACYRRVRISFSNLRSLVTPELDATNLVAESTVHEDASAGESVLLPPGALNGVADSTVHENGNPQAGVCTAEVPTT